MATVNGAISKGTYVHELRRDMTPCERTFWNAVRGRSISGVKFRRQHPYDGFILDFFAPEIRLVVEIDGDAHENPEVMRFDAWREGIPRASGLTIVRFQNAEIAVDLPNVLDRVQEAVADLRTKQR